MDREHPFYYTWIAQEQGQIEAQKLLCEAQDAFHFVLSGGEKVLDLSSISIQACLGHRPEFVHSAMVKQWGAFPMHSARCGFDLKKKVSRDICDLVHREGKVFYCVSGAEAVEHAIKMARMMTGRKVVAARTKSYHGATLGAVSLTGDWRGKIPPTVDEWTLRLPEPEEDPQGKMAREMVVRLGPQKMAGICLETITAFNGVSTPPDTWYRSIQGICDEFGIKLILDEVACGLYRTGKACAFHHYPFLRPHFVCMAKALTAGVFPLGAVWTDSSVADHFHKNVLCTGLTHYGHPLGLAAAGAVLDFFKRQTFEEERGGLEKVFVQELEKLAKLSPVVRVHYKGLMATIDWKGGGGWTDFISHGLYLMVREGMLFLAPPYNLERDMLRGGMERLGEAMEALSP